MQNKNRPLQRELPILPVGAKSHQGTPLGASSGNPAPAASKRRARHPLSQACGDLPPAAREELIKRVEQSGSVPRDFHPGRPDPAGLGALQHCPGPGPDGAARGISGP